MDFGKKYFDENFRFFGSNPDTQTEKFNYYSGLSNLASDLNNLSRQVDNLEGKINQIQSDIETIQRKG